MEDISYFPTWISHWISQCLEGLGKMAILHLPRPGGLWRRGFAIGSAGERDAIAMACDDIKVSTHCGTWDSASAAAFSQLSGRPALRKQSLWNGPWCLTVQQNLEMNWHMIQNTYDTYDTNWICWLMLLPSMFCLFLQQVEHSVDLGGVLLQGPAERLGRTPAFGIPPNQLKSEDAFFKILVDNGSFDLSCTKSTDGDKTRIMFLCLWDCASSKIPCQFGYDSQE